MLPRWPLARLTVNIGNVFHTARTTKTSQETPNLLFFINFNFVAQGLLTYALHYIKITAKTAIKIIGDVNLDGEGNFPIVRSGTYVLPYSRSVVIDVACP